MKLKAKFFGAVAVISGISGSLLVASTPAHANTFLEEVGMQLISAAIHGGLNGYQLTHEPFIDELSSGGSNYLTINLRAGQQYGILGVCDRDCGDLDITLYNDRGQVITSDTGDDDIPTVSLTPVRSGTYRVKVDMPNCQTRMCYYGVGVFGK
ncbi:MAG: hypothetical protein SAK29_04110 [Scytonema sp. PMC 1069.18]|nr:hypothetical protein [Scytonema sp. PMC 1069.18]MEC4884729.1 hypothetical protein [Scytonema sp. PMC 1070.18]